MQPTLASDLLMLSLLLLLFFATAWDIIKHIIPNLVSLAILICGVIYHVIWDGWAGSITALSGLLIGFFIFIPFYITGGMAAGDVKLMAAVGSLLGPQLATLAAGLSLIAGCLLALALVLLKGDLPNLFKRYYRILKTFCLTRQLIYEKPHPGDAAALRFPYALAIMAGTLLALAHQSQLNFYYLRSLFDGGVL
ncbi:prepilin peptidase [Amphritea atlantica]|uniref:Prepilin peptidase n=1 Tax=Amphritea atlantica TaxID=355243 RepID=A0ABY5GY62_9GAMM|nr:prepilin peptidase [Amphritea atlantica]